MSGRALGHAEHYKRLPIVALTANAFAEDREAAEEFVETVDRAELFLYLGDNSSCPQFAQVKVTNLKRQWPSEN